MKIISARTKTDILNCREAIIHLRPHLQKADLFQLVNEMIKNGYRLCYINEKGKAIAFVGYHCRVSLFDGKHIYIDDLCTLPAARGKGYASFLLDYVFKEAVKNGILKVTLDSGFTRLDAHRLYLNKKFVISSLHFSRAV